MIETLSPVVEITIIIESAERNISIVHMHYIITLPYIDILARYKYITFIGMHFSYD